MAKMIPILKVGRYKDASGRSYDITPSMLKELAETYKPNTAPLVKGHPNNDEPALGWVDRVKADGDTLFASFSQVAESFKNEVAEGLFKNVSASFFLPFSDANPAKGRYALRHVGALGAARPAIPELGTLQEALAFAESADGIVCFSDWEDNEEKKETLLQRTIKSLLYPLLEDYKQEIMAEVLTSLGLVSFSENTENNKTGNPVPATSSKTPLVMSVRDKNILFLGEDSMTEREKELQEQLKRSEEERKRLIAEREASDNKNKLEAEITKLRETKKLDDAGAKSLLEKALDLVHAGRRPEEAVAAFAEFLPDAEPQKTGTRIATPPANHNGKGAANFSEGNTPIEHTAEFADEVEKLAKEGLDRAAAYSQAKQNLSK